MSHSESDFENFCGSEEHPILFEIAEEVLESSPQPEDVDLASLDDPVEDDTLDVEDPALSEAVPDVVIKLQE
jgi:hypothetical protein